MPTLRERASDFLLRAGTDMAIDREETTRAITPAPRSAQGYELAMGALATARWVDSALLWLSWRLRPRTFSRTW
jgi:hypothetical protein